MEKIKIPTLIIGAGPAGLAAAMELAKAGKPFVIIEKNNRVGGLAKTYEFKEGDLLFRTDNGPHRFFSKNPYLYEFIGNLLGEKWIEVKRQTRQFIGGKFYDYPVNAFQALRNIGLWRASRMLFDYGIAKVKYGLLKKPIRNFADYVYANFGKSLGEFNMINYTEKIWGLPASEIHLDWAGQRIKGLSLRTLAKDAFGRLVGRRGSPRPKSLIDVFYYPDLGTGLIYEEIAKYLRDKGYRMSLGVSPTKIIHENGRIVKVLCEGSQPALEFECEHLIESVPLKQFLSLLDPIPSREVLEAQSRLRYRHQVYLFITLDKPSVTSDQWIYFPEKSNPIGRMSEMRNFSDKMSPPGKTSLFIEFFCSEHDQVWQMTDSQVLELALAQLVPLGFVLPQEVRRAYCLREENVYPIYDTNYQDYLSKIKNYLNNFTNLYYVGRPGRFRYNNQDHSLEMGFLAAKSIIDQVRYDIEAVGSEKEYYEKGEVRSR